MRKKVKANAKAKTKPTSPKKKKKKDHKLLDLFTLEVLQDIPVEPLPVFAYTDIPSTCTARGRMQCC